MNTLVYEGPERIVLANSAMPAIRSDELLIRVRSVGICGSELEGYLGHSSVRVPPLVMGHEFCGEVADIGAEAGGDWKLGDRVVVNPLIGCGECGLCLSGKANICRRRAIIGIHRPGAFAEFVAVPAASTTRVPAEMDADLASLAEPLAVAVHSVKLGLEPLEDIVIIGAGPIGLLTLQAAMQMGCRSALVIERQPARLQYAERLGAIAAKPEEAQDAVARLTGGSGVDTVIDCVGVAATRNQAMALVNPGGAIVMVGLGQNETALPLNDLVRREIRLLGSYTYSSRDFAQAVALLAQGRISMSGWAQGLPLADGPDAFDALAGGRAPVSKYILHP